MVSPLPSPSLAPPPLAMTKTTTTQPAQGAPIKGAPSGRSPGPSGARPKRKPGSQFPCRKLKCARRSKVAAVAAPEVGAAEDGRGSIWGRANPIRRPAEVPLFAPGQLAARGQTGARVANNPGSPLLAGSVAERPESGSGAQ